MTEVVIYNRAEICRRAGVIARQRREAEARRIFAAETQVVCGRIYQPRTLAEIIAATPIDRSGALSLAWAEVKGRASAPPRAGALVVIRPGRHGLAPLRRRIRPARLWGALVRVGRWLGSRFIPSRAA